MCSIWHADKGLVGYLLRVVLLKNGLGGSKKKDDAKCLKGFAKKVFFNCIYNGFIIHLPQVSTRTFAYNSENLVAGLSL